MNDDCELQSCNEVRKMNNSEILKAIEECEAVIRDANHTIDMANTLVKIGNAIAPDNTEQVMDMEVEDIFELLESIENDQVSPTETKKLAQDTKEFLKRIHDEDSYNDAMEILK